MLQMIIDFFKKLFGIGGGDEPVAALPSTPNVQVNIPSVPQVQALEFVRAPSDDAIRSCRGAELYEDEDDGERLWVDLWNTEMRPDQWVDEWGPNEPQDFDSYWHHKTQFEMAQQGDADEAEQKVLGYGYRDVGHFFQVGHTMRKYLGTPSEGADSLLSDYMFDSNRVMQAAQAGTMRYQQDLHAEAMAADPELLAPVDGVDVDTYASIAARAAAGYDSPEFVQLLAQNGIDLAKWEKVNAVWTDRMSKDTSGAIAMAYSKAFGGAGAGQYGAAAQAGAAVLGGRSVQEAAGDEPVPFEKLCEIQGAMTAWAETGQDVNAMLKHTFNMSAIDWSSISMWWMTKMQADISLMTRYGTESDRYAEQYKAQAGVQSGADDDLSF